MDYHYVLTSNLENQTLTLGRENPLYPKRRGRGGKNNNKIKRDIINFLDPKEDISKRVLVLNMINY